MIFLPFLLWGTKWFKDKKGSCSWGFLLVVIFQNGRNCESDLRMWRTSLMSVRLHDDMFHERCCYHLIISIFLFWIGNELNAAVLCSVIFLSSRWTSFVSFAVLPPKLFFFRISNIVACNIWLMFFIGDLVYWCWILSNGSCILRNSWYIWMVESD